MNAAAVGKIFDFSGEILSVTPMGNGRVNDTYLTKTAEKKYTLQRLNGAVFKNIPQMTDNILKVTAHLKGKRAAINPVPLKCADGKKHYLFHDGEYFWRAFEFIDGIVLERAESADDVYLVGLGFGQFQKDLSDFNAPLFETIPDFHNTPKRCERFLNSCNDDVCGRLKSSKDLVDKYVEHQKLADGIVKPLKFHEIPVRCTHNDTKINNIVLSEDKKAVKCVIDLDTVMNGSLLFDFGDMVRSCCNLGGEEGEYGTAKLNKEYFEALCFGFSKGGVNMRGREKSLLFLSSAVLTYECGMRFLTDYLQGDTYFKTTHENQNLIRARVHMEYLEDLMNNIEYIERVTREIFGN